MRALLRRALTRPLWWWQTRRPRPIRRRVFELPPRRVPPSGGNCDLHLLLMAPPAGVADAAWAAQSFLRHLGGSDPSLCLLLDAAPETKAALAAEAAWKRLYPGAVVQPSAGPAEILAARAPHVAKLARTHPLGRKLAGLLHFQEQGDVLYADADVLLFGPVPELEDAWRAGGPPLYNQDVGQLHADQELLAYAARIGAPAPAANLNSGLLFLPRGCLDVALAERLLAGIERTDSWYIEQTVVALLLGAAGAEPLPADRYVVSTQGQFYFEPQVPTDGLAARHFTSPVRHLMYGRAMPQLWREWRV
jgi:hypothetical protein